MSRVNVRKGVSPNADWVPWNGNFRRDQGLGLRGDFPQLVTSGSLMTTRENSRSSGEAMPLRTRLR